MAALLDNSRLSAQSLILHPKQLPSWENFDRQRQTWGEAKKQWATSGSPITMLLACSNRSMMCSRTTPPFTWWLPTITSLTNRCPSSMRRRPKNSSNQPRSALSIATIPPSTWTLMTWIAARIHFISRRPPVISPRLQITGHLVECPTGFMRTWTSMNHSTIQNSTTTINHQPTKFIGSLLQLCQIFKLILLLHKNRRSKVVQLWSAFTPTQSDQYKVETLIWWKQGPSPAKIHIRTANKNLNFFTMLHLIRFRDNPLPGLMIH